MMMPVVATFAREELGRWQILLKLRKEVLSGKRLSLEEINALCGHDAKHRRGWLVASSYDNPVAAAIGNALQTISNAVQGSSEWQAAKDEYERLNARLKQAYRRTGTRTAYLPFTSIRFLSPSGTDRPRR
jgi:hypothetical protein